MRPRDDDASVPRDAGASTVVPGAGGLARCLELLCDLLAQLPTRRFLRCVVEDARFLERVDLSAYGRHPARATAQTDAPSVARSMVARLERAVRFEVNDQTGQTVTRGEAAAARMTRLYAFQCACFARDATGDWELEVALAPTASLGDRSTLLALLQRAPRDALVDVCCNRLGLADCTAYDARTGASDARDAELRLLALGLANEVCARVDVVDRANATSHSGYDRGDLTRLPTPERSRDRNESDKPRGPDVAQTQEER